jgi:glutathione S-transferase
MQTTDLDSALSQTLSDAGKQALRLVIGNKNYSSWSMRPWLVLRAFGIAFQEIRIALDQADSANRIAQFSAAGRVPILLSGDLAVWDSMAICEYLAEQFPDKNLWPRNVAARGVARSVCAEMHAGFTGLRNGMPMNIRARLPGRGRRPEVQADIGRICEIWEACLSDFGHHEFLFGDFSIADAYFAPVVTRFRTYDVFLAPALQAYCERVLDHPAIGQWVAEACLETEVIARFEPPSGK